MQGDVRLRDEQSAGDADGFADGPCRAGGNVGHFGAVEFDFRQHQFAALHHIHRLRVARAGQVEQRPAAGDAEGGQITSLGSIASRANGENGNLRQREFARSERTGGLAAQEPIVDIRAGSDRRGAGQVADMPGERQIAEARSAVIFDVGQGLFDGCGISAAN